MSTRLPSPKELEAEILRVLRPFETHETDRIEQHYEEHKRRHPTSDSRTAGMTLALRASAMRRTGKGRTHGAARPPYGAAYAELERVIRDKWPQLPHEDFHTAFHNLEEMGRIRVCTSEGEDGTQVNVYRLVKPAAAVQPDGGAKGGRKTLAKDARKILEQHVTRSGSLPSVSDCVDIVKRKKGNRTCSRATVQKAIKDSPKLRTARRVRDTMAHPKSLNEAVADSTPQTRTPNPATDAEERDGDLSSKEIWERLMQAAPLSLRDELKEMSPKKREEWIATYRAQSEEKRDELLATISEDPDEAQQKALRRNLRSVRECS